MKSRTEQPQERDPAPPASRAFGRASIDVAHSPRLIAQRERIAAVYGPHAKSVQRFVPPTASAGGETSSGSANPTQERGGLPATLRAGIEALSGLDMSGVRVHRSSSKPAQVNAAAYAQGNDIHLGSGQDRHLAHEAWHIVQQRQGRVTPTLKVGGIDVNDEPALEREADIMGARARTMGSRALAESRGAADGDT